MKQTMWRTCMKKKFFLGVLLSTLLVPMMSGCGSADPNKPKYVNNLGSLNKTSIGEGSINNISKYTAIGVGKLDKSKPNQRYRFVDELKNDETETDDSSLDLSNTLIGLTTEGILEELSLTIQGGQQINSSTFTITYYQEIGDFVLVSVLPMDVDEYVNGVFGDGMRVEDPYTWNETKQQYDVVYTKTYKELTAFAIESLNYPLKYSIRYLDNETNEYRYIDTSYLIHKRSGKLFPFSSRKYCVNPQKCINGEFLNPTIVVDNEEVDNYPINSLVNYFWYQGLEVGYYWKDEEKKPSYWVPEHKSYFPYYEIHNDCYPISFDNGFCILIPECEYINIEKTDESIIHYENTFLYTVVFDEDSSNLEITNLKVRRQNEGWSNSDENIVTISYSFHVDRFGNFVCEYKGRNMYYNVYSKAFGKINVNINSAYWPDYDRWSRQHYIRANADIVVDGVVTGTEDSAIFLNEQMEEDYIIRWEFFWFHEVGDISLPPILECQNEFFERSEAINKYERLVYCEDKLVKLSLDENYHYSTKLPGKVIYRFPEGHFYCDKERCYYIDGLSVHKVTFSNDYETIDDKVLVSLEDYPYIDNLWYVGNDVVAFDGMDSQLNTITGYIYPDGTISFEIEEFDVDSSTSTLSPIN